MAEFKVRGHEAYARAKKIRFRFGEDQDLASYLREKAAMLRQTGTMSDEVLISEAWNSLDYELKRQVPLVDGETWTQFQRRVREYEPGAHLTWQNQQRASRSTKSGQAFGRPAYGSSFDRPRRGSGGSPRRGRAGSRRRSPQAKRVSSANKTTRRPLDSKSGQDTANRAKKTPPYPCRRKGKDGKECGQNHWERDHDQLTKAQTKATEGQEQVDYHESDRESAIDSDEDAVQYLRDIHPDSGSDTDRSNSIERD